MAYDCISELIIPKIPKSSGLINKAEHLSYHVGNMSYPITLKGKMEYILLLSYLLIKCCDVVVFKSFFFSGME